MDLRWRSEKGGQRQVTPLFLFFVDLLLFVLSILSVVKIPKMMMMMMKEEEEEEKGNGPLFCAPVSHAHTQSAKKISLD